MSTLLFKSDSDRADGWRHEIRRHRPDLDFRIYPDVGDPAAVRFALVWRPDRGYLRTLPNLKAIFSLGAGVDHLLSDPDLPAHVPVVRMIDPGLTERMTEYVLLHVLRYHRQHPHYAASQRVARWHELPGTDARRTRVGIMGIGVLGSHAATTLATLNFDVAGWSRTPKQVTGVTPFHGRPGLEAFLARTDILVCLLPLTPDTEGVLNADLFARLPAGARLINVARGGHLVEDDLIPALDSGRLAAATLDVFRQEPLPADHPFWRHPQITITPHVASITLPDTAAIPLVENIARVEAGQAPLHAVDPAVGY